MKLTFAIAHLLYFIFLVDSANATSIIAVRVNEQVIVGTDSKTNRRSGYSERNSD